MLSYFSVFLAGLALSTSTVDSSSSSDESTPAIPVVVKSVLATTNYVDAYNSVMYMLPTAESQEIAINECGDSGKEEWSDNMFQLHQPYVPIHSSGQFQPTIVEAAFNQKWLYYKQTVDNLNNDYSDISSLIYEQFFDHSFALYKNNIIDNIKVVQDQSNNGLNWDILYTFMKWNLPEEVDGKNTFISLLLYVPTTQVTIELITEYTSDYDQYLENEVVFETEPRMSFKGFEDYTYPWDSEYTVVPIKQSRAVTDLETNVAWYVDFMKAEVLMTGETEVNDRTVKYTNLYVDYGYGFEIGIYERSADDSYGEFPLDVYEKGINSVHRDITVSSTCGFNRWFDNHYALNLIENQDSFKAIYDSIQESGQRYILFAYTSDLADDFGKKGLEMLGIDYFFLLYPIEPNGNTIEMVGYFEDDDLASNTVKWEGQFCPEKCTTSKLFSTNFIDNGQYTAYGKTLDKYKGTLVDESNENKKSSVDDFNYNDYHRIELKPADSKHKEPEFKYIFEADSSVSGSHKHKKKSKNSKTVAIYIIIGLVSTFAGFTFVYLLYSIYQMRNKKPSAPPVNNSEKQPLKSRYGSTAQVIIN